MERTMDDRILELASLSSQIRAIALCVTTADIQEITVDNLMHGIISLSGLINDKLDALCSEGCADE